MKTPQEKWPLSISDYILLTMSNMGCSVECFCVRPYCEEHKIPSLSINEFILVYIGFSKILLKLDNKEIGL